MKALFSRFVADGNGVENGSPKLSMRMGQDLGKRNVGSAPSPRALFDKDENRIDSHAQSQEHLYSSYQTNSYITVKAQPTMKPTLHPSSSQTIGSAHGERKIMAYGEGVGDAPTSPTTTSSGSSKRYSKSVFSTFGPVFSSARGTSDSRSESRRWSESRLCWQ
jgi:hypothetical protein